MKNQLRITLNGIFLFIVGLLIFAGCSIVQQVNQMKPFARCEFRLKSAENIRLAGVDVGRYKSVRDLNFADGARFALALSQKELPLSLTLNVEVKNPNTESASMNRMNWRMFIDENEIAAGLLQEKVSVSGSGGVSTLPLKASADLKKVLTGKTVESIGNFAFNLAGEGNQPTRFMLKVKPTIDVLGFAVEYPEYFDVKTEFTSGMAETVRESLTK